MSLDNILLFISIPIEAALLGLLTYKRVWRVLPFFCTYCLWDLSSNIAVHAFLQFYRNAASFIAVYEQIYTIETIIDSTLIFCVLVELAWSVLRPLRSSLPRGALIVIAVLILLAGGAIWPFAALANLSHAASRQWLLLTQFVHTVSILRILFFLLLAAGSQLLSIGWRDRELQIATGLGFYSIVSIAVSILQGHQSTIPQYHNLYDFVVVAFLCSLLYWTYCFSQKEAERRQFTPQMQNLLLAMAGAARSTRVALEDSRAGKPPKTDQR